MNLPAKIFVQTSPGSFNHHALELLREEDILQNPDIQFAGPQKDAMQKAVDENGLVFAAVCNDIVQGNLIPSTVDALKDFEIKELHEGIRMKIEMCLLRTEKAVRDNTPLVKVVSHPAALKQITHWAQKRERPLELAEEIGGTSEAARQLSAGELDDTAGAIAPEWSAKIYPGLVVTEKNIQNQDDNYTHFGLMKVQKRNVQITVEEARKHLQEFVDRLKDHIDINSDFYQVAKVA